MYVRKLDRNNCQVTSSMTNDLNNLANNIIRKGEYVWVSEVYASTSLDAFFS